MGEEFSIPAREEPSFDFSGVVAEAASRAAGEMKARCILALTMTGFTARLVSKFKPGTPS
jgi:pyruvate kinase